MAKLPVYMSGQVLKGFVEFIYYYAYETCLGGHFFPFNDG